MENTAYFASDSAVRVSAVAVMLPNGEELYIPAREAEGSGDVVGALTALKMDRLVKIIDGFQQALQPIMRSALPEKTKLEIGLEVSVEAGKLMALLVDGNMKGNVKLSFEWAKPSPSEV